MRYRLAIIVAATVGLGLSSGRATGMTDGSVLPLRDRVLIVSQVYASIHRYFAYLDRFSRDEIERLHQKYMAQAIEAEDRYHFDLVMMEFLASLRNGHTDFSDDWLDDRYGQPLGFYACPLAGQWVVTYSRRQDLQVGDIILAIDTIPIEDFFQEKRRYLSASDDHAARTHLFQRPYLFPSKFTVATATKKTVAISRMKPLLQPGSDRLSSSGKWLAGQQVAYLSIASFDPEVEDRLGLLLSEFRGARRLILDLRGNGGGATPERFLQRLMDRPYRLAAEATPMQIALFSLFGEMAGGVSSERLSPYQQGYLEAMSSLGASMKLVWSAAWRPPATDPFRGELVMLIDRHCASACENFLMPFKDNQRATLIGERTQGSSGQPYYYSFDNGMAFRLGAKEVVFPDGSTFEGIGIAPDVETVPTVEDLRQGRDPVLRAAETIKLPTR